MLFRFLFSLCLLLSSIAIAPAAAQVQLVRVPNGGSQPRAIVDMRDVIHLLYYSGDPAHGDLYYVTSSDGGKSWSRPLRVNSPEGTAVALGTIRGGQLALGRKGSVYVVWNGSSKAEAEGPLNPESGHRGMPLLFTRLSESHTRFEPPRNLMTRTFGLDGGAAVTADDAGNVYVAWHAKAPGAPSGEAGRQVWIRRSTDDGKTFEAERPAISDPTGACGCCGMAIYAEPNGVLYGLYRSATQDVHRDIYLLTSYDHAANFSDRLLHPWNINACPMSSMDFASAAGKVEAAWETGGQVYFENVASPSARPISPPGQGNNRKHPRLAIARNGETLLVWTEGTGWGHGGSIAWQTYDPSGTPIAEKGGESGLPAWSFAAAVTTRTGFVILY